MESTGSSATGNYSDGVYSIDEKTAAQIRYAAVTNKPLPRVKRPILPTVMLVALVLLFIFCFIGILMTGLNFGHRVSSTWSSSASDSLGQSWIMCSSLLGWLYIALHLRAAWKSEPVNRSQPPSQHPLHSSAIVVARLDAIAWIISLIIVAVAVARDPSAVSCVNLVACAAVVLLFGLILGVDQTATRPFDLPYLTTIYPSPASSTITCRVSDFMNTMPEVAVEDSISRRGSAHSATSQRSAPRPNSHTQHAAAIAAANSVGTSAGLSGPRPPPTTVKEARPWNFTSFDDRTKKELAASVTEATQASETRHHVGGPRALGLSEKALQTGILPPPVCLAPKVVPLPRRDEADKENAPRTTPNTDGAWRKDWSALAADTGYQSAATTPASTPALGSYGVPAHSRRLSPVAEDTRRLSSAVQQASIPSVAAYRPRELVPQQQQQQQQYLPAPLTTSRTYSTPAPRSVAPPSYTYNTQQPPQPPQPAPRRYTYGDSSASIPRPPPPAAASPPARVRLIRAQEALKVRGGRDTVVMLKRPPMRVVEDQRVVAPVRPEYRRMPGSFEEY